MSGERFSISAFKTSTGVEETEAIFSPFAFASRSISSTPGRIVTPFFRMCSRKIAVFLWYTSSMSSSETATPLDSKNGRNRFRPPQAFSDST